MSSELSIPIPSFSVKAVEAIGAYTFAYAVCAIIYAVSVLLWKTPALSRSTRAAAKSMCLSSLISIALLSSLLSVEWMISTLNSQLGVPDWRATLQPLASVLELGDALITFTVAMMVPFLTAIALMGLIATVFAPMLLIVNLIHGLFAHFAYFLMFLAVIAVAALLLVKLVGVIAGFASIAHYLVAGGVALFPIPWTKRVGVSLIIFGLVLFYGLPFMFGLIAPAPPPNAPPEELAKANLLRSLNRETTPVNLVVASEYGGLMPWAYLEMNSSVEYEAPLESDPSKLPPGSTYIGTVSYVDPVTNEGVENQLWRYHFAYSRIYNGSYPLALEALQNPIFFNPHLLPISALLQYVVAERSLFARTTLYKQSEITTLWYQGYVLNVTRRSVVIEGGVDLERPDPDLMNVKSTQEYYDKIYQKAPIYVVVARNVDSLNANSTAYIFYSPEVYLRNPVNKIERLDKGEYLYKFRLNRTSYSCWVSRVENRTDPETNSSYLVYFYRARASYEGVSDELYSSSINGAPVRHEITHFKAADSWWGGYQPELIVSESSPEVVVSRRLAEGFRPLKLVPQYKIQEEFGGIGEKQIEAAREGGYLPGEVVGGADGLYTHIIERPRELELSPRPDVRGYKVKGMAVREAGEVEGRCPGLPSYIDVEAKVKFSSSDTAAWSYLSLMEWEPMAEWGEKAYHTLYEMDPKHNLTTGSTPAYGVPVSRMTSVLFSEMESRLSSTPVVGSYAVELLSYLEEMVKWVFAIMLPLVFADAVSALLGGVSIAGGMLSTFKQVAGTFMSSITIFRGAGLTPSMNKFFKLIGQKQDEALIANIEQLKMRGSLTALGLSYAALAERSYFEARSKPSLAFRRTNKSIFGGRIQVPWIEAYSPRAEAMNEFRQAASRVAPEMSTLAQKLNRPAMVEITPKEARQILSKLPPALMFTKEGKELFLAAVGGKEAVKVPETLLKGEVEIGGSTSRNIAFAANPYFTLVRRIFGPKEAESLSRKAEQRRLLKEADVAVDFDYFSKKKVVLFNKYSSPSETISMRLNVKQAGADEKDVMMLKHEVSAEYSRGDYHVNIDTSEIYTARGRDEEGGRSFKFDLPHTHKVEIEENPSEWARAEADIIGAVRGEDHQKAEELLRHTNHEGYDWYWVAGPVAEQAAPAEPADFSVNDFLVEARDVAESSTGAARDEFYDSITRSISSDVELKDGWEPLGDDAAGGGDIKEGADSVDYDLIDYAADALSQDRPTSQTSERGGSHSHDAHRR